MTGLTVQLNIDELWSAVDGIDLVGVLLDEVVARTAGDPRRRRQRVIRPIPWDGEGGEVTEQAQDRAVLEDRRTGGRCVLPSGELRTVRVAGLAALAARWLLPPGIVTMVILASGTAAELQASVIARYVSGVSHIAIWTQDCPQHRSMGPRVLDQLDLASIELSVTEHVDDAVRGANLVTVVGPETGGLNFSQLAKGALVVSCLGRELPRDIVTGVDQVYVDDSRLLWSNPHQQLATLAPADLGQDVTRRWHREDRDRPRPIDADLGQVVTGKHPGRMNLDDILLVELLSADELGVELAYRLHQTALKEGLGVRRLG